MLIHGPRDPVRRSPDLDRVLALPRRPPVDLIGSPTAQALVELMGERLGLGSRACACAFLGRRHCIDKLLPAQAWALFEAGLSSGLLGALGVGSGKSLLDILAPLVVRNCSVAALFVPPGLVGQLEAEYLAIREHFRVPSLVLPGAAAGHVVPGAPRLHVVPYSRFSRAEATEMLEELKPDLIISDECHKVRALTAARTIRILRYFANHPETRLCAWSGTVTSKSIKDFAHLSAFALGEKSPLPLDPDQVQAWSAAVDPSDWPAPAGALNSLRNPGEPVREALSRRIFETRGVVSTRGSATGVANYFRERNPGPLPSALERLISDLRASWTRPDGEELVLALDVARCAKELACGFYYRWRFPGNPDLEDVAAWFLARRDWHKKLREKLKNPRPHLDSPLLCAKAAIRHYAGYTGELPTWASEAWPRWRDLRNSIKHETEAVWVDDYLVRDAAAWSESHRGVIWYESAALGRAVSEAGGIPMHGGGPDAEARIRAERGDRSIAASISSHSEGRDGLQYLFSEQLVMQPPSSGQEWEQLLGRVDRQGQKADEVITHVYRHHAEFREPVDRAVEYARYIEGITSANQRLLAANVEFDWHKTGAK